MVFPATLTPLSNGKTARLTSSKATIIGDLMMPNEELMKDIHVLRRCIGWDVDVVGWPYLKGSKRHHQLMIIMKEMNVRTEIFSSINSVLFININQRDVMLIFC